MWIAEVLECVEDAEGIQKTEIVCFIESGKLRTIYEAAMHECRDRKCALAAIYEGLSMEEVENDDSTKAGTKARYLISKGGLGGIFLWGKNHSKKLIVIRENGKAGSENETE